VDEAEEVGHHLNGEHARGSGNLHDKQDDGHGLADVTEGVGQGEHEVHVHEHGEQARPDEGRRALALDAQHEVASAAHKPHGQAAHHIEQPAPEVGLHGGELRQSLRIHPQLHHGHENEAGHPQRQVREEGRHAAAIVSHGVHKLCVQGHGRRHEAADLGGIGFQIFC
jgi:hypothetical protein